jgi:hypothetical protein
MCFVEMSWVSRDDECATPAMVAPVDCACMPCKFLSK